MESAVFLDLVDIDFFQSEVRFFSSSALRLLPSKMIYR